MKRVEKNEKQESDNALFVERGKNFNRGRHQVSGGAGAGRGARSANFNFSKNEVWHRRLGHINYTYMNQLAKKEMVDGINRDIQTQTQKECEACVL